MHIGKARGAGLLVDGYSQGIDLLAPSRMRTNIVDDRAHAVEQSGIVQCRLTHSDPVLTELAGFSDESGRVGKCPHRNWPIIGRHAAKLITGYERGFGTQVCGPERGNDTRRP